MQHLWAPWRVGYITDAQKHKKGCVFCRMLKDKKDEKSQILIRREFSFVVLNIFPYNNGHLLILPNRHVDDLSKLSQKEKQELWGLLEETKDLLDRTLKPAGYNIGINLGRIAGAGFPGHLHIHVVPRWNGDANFMPVVAHTKVISQSLNELYKLLNDAYKKRH
ncbi:MAG: HIT domain-containing protein [Candidatus Omnitrophica bacterium]|nr:HIT domain-containing protein [Candidatus Omnitrophota bacterium]